MQRTVGGKGSTAAHFMKLPFFGKRGKGHIEPSKPWPKPIVTGKQINAATVQPRDADVLRQFTRKMMRLYEAAISNNLNLDFPISIGSANAEVFTSVLAGRARARTLERDNPYAFAILQSYQNNVCGDDPFRLEMNVGAYDSTGKWIKETKTNRLIESAWKEAMYPENCTVRRDMSRLELDCQVILSLIRDAGYIAEHVRDFPNNKFRYGLKPLEIDRLDHFWQGQYEATGNDIKHSIELDQWGGPVAYWILTKHPGDIFYISGFPKEQYRRRVKAEDIIVIHDMRSRAEQLISMPRFSSVIQRLHRIDQFDIAHVTAAIWSACKPLFIKKTLPTSMEYVPANIRTAMESAWGQGSDDHEKTEALDPGQTQELNFGEEPVLVDPKFPVESATDFKKEHLRAAAAGSGAAYHVIANDLESVNFSSGRIGLEEFRAGCKILQRHFILSFRRPHFNAWLENAILSGAIDLPMRRLSEFQLAATFHGRRWEYIQPLQDAQADQIKLQNRTTSRDRIIQESDRGGNYETVAGELASDVETDEGHELSVFTPGQPTPMKENDEEQSGEQKVKETDEEKLGKSRNGNNGHRNGNLSRI